MVYDAWSLCMEHVACVWCMLLVYGASCMVHGAACVWCMVYDACVWCLRMVHGARYSYVWCMVHDACVWCICMVHADVYGACIWCVCVVHAHGLSIGSQLHGLRGWRIMSGSRRDGELSQGQWCAVRVTQLRRHQHTSALGGGGRDAVPPTLTPEP